MTASGVNTCKPLRAILSPLHRSLSVLCLRELAFHRSKHRPLARLHQMPRPGFSRRLLLVATLFPIIFLFHSSSARKVRTPISFLFLFSRLWDFQLQLFGFLCFCRRVGRVFLMVTATPACIARLALPTAISGRVALESSRSVQFQRSVLALILCFKDFCPTYVSHS